MWETIQEASPNKNEQTGKATQTVQLKPNSTTAGQVKDPKVAASMRKTIQEASTKPRPEPKPNDSSGQSPRKTDDHVGNESGAQTPRKEQEQKRTTSTRVKV